MAGMLIYGVAYLAVKAADAIQTKRSPVVPMPSAVRGPAGDEDEEDVAAAAEHDRTRTATTAGTSSSDSNHDRPFTQRQLKACYRAWQARLDSLWSEQRGLEFAIAHGWEVCWAGRTSEYPTVRRARSEAAYVVHQLSLALLWCRTQNVPKTSYITSLRKTSKRKRQSFPSCPPSLLELPSPIPDPPRDRDYTLVIERPPRLARDEVRVAPPIYSPGVDEETGERMLEFTTIEAIEARR